MPVDETPKPAPEIERGPGEPPEASSSQIDWLRQPLQRLRPSVIVYAKPKVVEKIRATLHMISGDNVVRLFRSGCFRYFLDYMGGDVQKNVIHALMTHEVRVLDHALVGRKAWFQIYSSQLSFG